MSYYVPEFEMEDDQHFISTSSTTTHQKADDEILELLWQGGQVVAQPQSQHKPQSSTATAQQTQYQQNQQQQHLYMAEDEMATWLHYPIEDMYSDLLGENQSSPLPPVSTVRQPQEEVRPPPPAAAASAFTTATTSSPVRPPLGPQPPKATMNFQMFSRMRGKGPEVSSSMKPGLTVVESNSTPLPLARMKSMGEVSSVFPGGERLLDKGGGSGEVTVSSSSGGYSGGPTNTTTGVTASENAGDKGVKSEVVEGRKRKQREIGEPSSPTTTTTTDQDVELEAEDGDEKKHSRSSHGSKRSRAAEVHNLSERRRRDRINEKMKALQELIPRCNKSDKASMLDEAIEYLKSLQMQVQMMSMGYGMVPMMYPGLQQQYMPPMGLGMNRPMMPFPSNIPGSNMQPPPAVPPGPQYAPRFTVPPIRMPPAATSNFSVNQPSSQADSGHSLFPVQSPSLPQVPNMADPYQQYMALQQMQMQMQMQMQAAQNQSISQPGSSRPSVASTSKSEGQPGPSTSKSEAEDDQ